MVTKTKLMKLTWNVHAQQWTTQTNIFIHLLTIINLHTVLLVSM